MAVVINSKGERLSFHAHMTVVLLSVDLVDSLAMVASTYVTLSVGGPNEAPSALNHIIILCMYAAIVKKIICMFQRRCLGLCFLTPTIRKARCCCGYLSIPILGASDCAYLYCLSSWQAHVFPPVGVRTAVLCLYCVRSGYNLLERIYGFQSLCLGRAEEGDSTARQAAQPRTHRVRDEQGCVKERGWRRRFVRPLDGDLCRVLSK